MAEFGFKTVEVRKTRGRVKIKIKTPKIEIEMPAGFAVRLAAALLACGAAKDEYVIRKVKLKKED
jgi:hypothetical protein